MSIVRKKQEETVSMPTLQIPNDASIHTLRNFLSKNDPFSDSLNPATLRLNKNWAYMDPMALSMTAAWGGWCRRKGLEINVENMDGRHVNYAARMKLFQHLQVPCDASLAEHEESGRFMPLSQVKTKDELEAVLASVSALLHLDTEPDGLAAVRYCVSELVRNVFEHSGSPDKAYVCAQRYVDTEPRRVSIAVADCGWGIAEHLGHIYPEARTSNARALDLAMRPGITGAQSGMYGSPDNAGAGLFITRAIAKVTGGYFVLISGDAAYRLRRRRSDKDLLLYANAFEEPRHDFWTLDAGWQGTVAAVEIATEKIGDFPAFFQWVRQQLPASKTAAGKIRFT